MDRREALKALGTALSLPILGSVSSTELFALGEEAHARLQSSAAGGRYVFKALDPRQNQTVTAIAELIIPETDTPGATEARANEFIDLMLTEWFPTEDGARFFTGLVELDEKSRELAGSNFIECQPAQQTQILEALEEEALQFRDGLSEEEFDETSAAGGIAQRHFFDFMKWLTLWSYYTSEVGMKEEIHQRRIHPAYQGCVPLER
jgi:hypothetical protein